MKPRLTVVIVTLGRRPASLQKLLGQLKEQTLDRARYQVIVWEKTPEDMNEYDQINKAMKVAKFTEPQDVIITLGDDHEADPDFLEKGLRYFEDNPELMVQTVAVTGAMWSSKIETDARDHMGPGGGLWTRYIAYKEVGGYQVNWGLRVSQSGWRGDSGMLYAIIDRYGESAYRNTPEVTVYHYGRSETVWQPLIEREFWRHYKKHVKKYMLPIDPRLAQLVLAVETADEDGSFWDQEAIDIAHKVLDEFIAKKMLTEDGIAKSVQDLANYFAEYDKEQTK